MAASGESQAVAINDLRFSFDGQSASGFRLSVQSLGVRHGQHTACIGPSGCGKTTLLRLLTGILLPRTGSVQVNDRLISGMSDRERRAFRISTIGLVLQHFALLDYLTGFDNILLPYRVNRALRLTSEVRTRAKSLAEQTGIGHVLRRRPRRLSHGERQRVAICRALVTKPRLVICDEPTGNLDPSRSQSTVELILREANAMGATVLMVTHDHSLLDQFEQVIDMTNWSTTGEEN